MSLIVQPVTLPMITFDSVSKSFGDEGFALHDISFTIQPGELVVLTGPSGSGKTTLMRLLTKEYTPTDGEIYFEDQPLSEIKKSRVHQHRRKIGVVFQDYKLIPDLNVWENIALSLNIVGQRQSEIEQRVTDLLHLINLSDKAFLFPSQLSGGEAQRVSIARALATAPSLIFADEPTGNLDAETSASIARLLQKINKLGTTVMICTHDVGVLDLLVKERHMRLEQGRLVKDTGTTHHKKAKDHVSDTTHEKNDKQEKSVAQAHQPKTTTETLDDEPKTEVKERKPAKAGFKLQLPKFSFGSKKKDNGEGDQEEEELELETTPQKPSSTEAPEPTGSAPTEPTTPPPSSSTEVSKVTIENV